MILSGIVPPSLPSFVSFFEANQVVVHTMEQTILEFWIELWSQLGAENKVESWSLVVKVNGKAFARKIGMWFYYLGCWNEA